MAEPKRKVIRERVLSRLECAHGTKFGEAIGQLSGTFDRVRCD